MPGFALAVGCAPTLFQSQATYATVVADPKHDSQKAQQQFQAAMKILDDYVKCDRSPAKLEKAETCLQQAMVADVRFGPAHNALGTVYFYENKLYLSACEFQYAMKLMPDRYEPLNNIGLIFETAGKYDQAISFYRQALEKSPQQPDVIANLARAEVRSGKSVDEARGTLEDVAATNPQCEWRNWASELLGLHPANGSTIVSLGEPKLLPSLGPEQGKVVVPENQPEELPTPKSSPPPKSAPLEKLPEIHLDLTDPMGAHVPPQ